MNVEEWLLQVRKLDALIDAKLAEKRRLRSMASDITGKPYDGMPFTNTGAVSNRVQDSVIKIIECEREIDRLVDEYTDRKAEVSRVMERLPAAEFRIMHLYYIMGWKWEDIAVATEYSVTQIWRLKKRALRRLEAILAEDKEDGR